MATFIRIRLRNGRILTLDRAEATALVEELDATHDLPGALSLSTQLTAALRASSLLLGGPIELLGREEDALSNLLALLDPEPLRAS